MISLKELAETLRLLTLVDIKNLSEMLYINYGIEFNMSVDMWRAREIVRNSQRIVDNSSANSVPKVTIE